MELWMQEINRVIQDAKSQVPIAVLTRVLAIVVFLLVG